MAETNTAILDELEKGERKFADAAEAEREKALATYWSILGDPTRTGKEDKAAMADAMKVLGKTLADADDDSRIIEMIAMEVEARRIVVEAQAASRAASAAVLEGQCAHRAGMKQLNEQLRLLRVAVIDREREWESAGSALGDIRGQLEANADAVRNARRFIK